MSGSLGSTFTVDDGEGCKIDDGDGCPGGGGRKKQGKNNVSAPKTPSNAWERRKAVNFLVLITFH